MTADNDNVLHRLVPGDAVAVVGIVERAHTSDDVATIVTAVLTGAGHRDLMARAARLATTVKDRQLVTIAAAHLAGDTERAEDLAREHLADHPDDALIAWITAANDHPDRTKGPSVTTTSPTVPRSTSTRRIGGRASHRPWFRWLLTALAFPPAGLIAHLVAGRVDSVPAAVLGGLVAGAGIGAAQWALLRHRGVGVTWVAATAAGLAAGLAVGATIVSYRTDIMSLAVMGAVSGLGVGVAQGALLGGARRTLRWAAATAALWALGWTVTTAGGIDVDQQWVVFGAYGCLTLAFLQSFIVRAFVPNPAEEVAT